MRRLAAAAVTVLAALLLTPITAVAPAQADHIRDLQYWLDDYGIRQAWNTTRGSGVTIAVIDSGIDSSHPDLRGAVAGGTDVSGIGAADGQRGIGASPEHGTMVASLLAGRGNAPGDGVIGVAPEARLLSVSVAFGVAGLSTDVQIAEGIIWAVDNGADVINMSLTRNSLDWPRSWDEAFLYAYEHDVVIVAAAGNRGSGTTQVGAPATIPGVLTVAGVDRRQNASFDASSQGVTIAVSAPSEELVGAIPGGNVVMWQGTSGAAPIVAGVVALVRSAHPELDAANVIQRIVATAKPKSNRAVDPIYGYGLVDAARAVSARVAEVDANPMGDLAEWVRLYRRAQPEPTTAPEPPAAEPEDTLESETGAGFWDAFPSVLTLRNEAVPLLIVSGFALLGVLLLIAAGRQLWRLKRNE